jgi:hypothetical protein
MGCQKQIAGDIIEKQGDYVFTLKGNHPEVYAEVRDCFNAAIPDKPGYTEVTKDHGRIEKREAWLDTDISWFAGREQGGTERVRLYPLDGQGHYLGGHPLFSEQPHGHRSICPVGQVPLGHRKQTPLDAGCGVSGGLCPQPEGSFSG